MELTTQPLVYYASQADYENHYLSGNRPTSKQVVFVGDSKMIYTHGVVFNGNNNVYTIANTSTAGLVKVGYTTNNNNRVYAVNVDANGNAYVNVPWQAGETSQPYDDTELRNRIVTLENREDQNTTYGQATSSTLGLIKIGYAQSGKNYPVQLNNDGQAYVNVPWYPGESTQPADPYDDTELRNAISSINGSISTLDSLVQGVRNDLDDITEWTSQDIQNIVNGMMNDAAWLRNKFTAGQIFHADDWDNELKAYLKLVGLIEEYDDNGVTKTRTTWSTFQQSYDQLALRVSSLEAGVGEQDLSALQADLEAYVDTQIGAATTQLSSKWALLDTNENILKWMTSGMSSYVDGNNTFAQLWAAAQSSIGTNTSAIAAVKTRVDTIEGNYVSTAELATKVENAGFAKTAGVVAKSDLDSAVAALFSQTSSTSNAVDGVINNKTAGFLTQTDLDNATATMVATSDLNGKIEDYLTTSAGTSGKWAAGVQSSVSTANSNATSALNQADANATAISTMFASGGAGAAYVQAYVNNAISGITLRADKITLQGTTWADTIFADIINTRELHVSDTSNGDTYNIDIDKTNFIKLTNRPSGYANDITMILDPTQGMLLNDPSQNLQSALTWTGYSVDYNINGNNSKSLEFDVSSGISHHYGNNKYSSLDYNGLSVTDTNTNRGTTVLPAKIEFEGAVDGVNIDCPGIIQSSYQIKVNDGTSETDINPGGVITEYVQVKTTGQSVDNPLNNKSFTNIDDEGIHIYAKQNNRDYNTWMDGVCIELSDENGQVIWIDGKLGEITAMGSINDGSDGTLKDIISDTTLTVEQVANAPAVNFTWKKDADKEDKKVNVGTIAQYWQVVLPEVVKANKDGILTMQYGNASMVSAIVTAKEVVALKEEIAELKRQIAELKAN